MCLEHTLMCFVCVGAYGAHMPVFFLSIFSIAQTHKLKNNINVSRTYINVFCVCVRVWCTHACLFSNYIFHCTNT